MEEVKVKENMCGYLKEGMYKKDAAIMAGISEATFYRWVEEDESFESRVEANILEYKRSLIKTINTCAEKDGRLALEVLRRRFPDTDGYSEKAEESDRSIKKLVETIDRMLALPHEEIVDTEKTEALQAGTNDENPEAQVSSAKNDNFIS